jgi:hypothetical protein
MKTCSSTYLLQVMWLVQLSSSNGGVGHQLQDPISGLFHQQSVERLQNSVFPHHEAHLRITDNVSQAIQLFSGAPDRGSHIIDSGQNIE